MLLMNPFSCLPGFQLHFHHSFLYPRELLFYPPNQTYRDTLKLCINYLLGAKPCALHGYQLITVTTLGNKDYYFSFIDEETETGFN